MCSRSITAEWPTGKALKGSAAKTSYACTSAAACRLLQRKCASDVLGIAFSSVDIRRTKGGKPFAVAEVSRPHAPNFNFNVSHEVTRTRHPGVASQSISLHVTHCSLGLVRLRRVTTWHSPARATVSVASMSPLHDTSAVAHSSQSLRTCSRSGSSSQPLRWCAGA